MAVWWIQHIYNTHINVKNIFPCTICDAELYFNCFLITIGDNQQLLCIFLPFILLHLLEETDQLLIEGRCTYTVEFGWQSTLLLLRNIKISENHIWCVLKWATSLVLCLRCHANMIGSSLLLPKHYWSSFRTPSFLQFLLPYILFLLLPFADLTIEDTCDILSTMEIKCLHHNCYRNFHNCVRFVGFFAFNQFIPNKLDRFYVWRLRWPFYHFRVVLFF